MDPRLEETLRITEIYRSLQGESTWAGLPCVFVRLTGCPLRCVWCDTEYAFYGGERVPMREILDRVAALNTRLAEITGGEPLAQKACGTLAELLIERGYTVLVETSGALPIDRLPEAAIRIMDLKCPDSGECEKNDWSNIERLSGERDEVKFVIASRRDYEWARSAVLDHRLETRCKCVLFSPVFGTVEPRDLTAWILEDGLPVRFQLQLHKLIWSPDAKGV